MEVLAKQGYKQATLKQIQESLWRLSHGEFEDREEFDEYWNNAKVGVALKKMGVKRGRIGKRRTRIYYLEADTDSP